MVKMGAREFVYPNFGYRSRWLRNRDPVCSLHGLQPLTYRGYALTSRLPSTHRKSAMLEIYQPSQPTAAGRRRRISGYERHWAAILPAITRQRAAAVKTDHVICHLKRWNCLQRAFSGPLMSKWSVSGVFLNILKTFRNNHDRKN